MRKALRHDDALRLLLEHVVADRLGRAHAFLDVARLEDVALRVTSVRRPHTGVAVGLQLDADLDRVALGAAGALLCTLSLVERAFEALDVMPDLVRDHVSRGEVAGGSKPLR